ncbi:MAG: hypothetical protein MEP57_05665 [Microvirga sp.]|nr:hypothetical protein [Microvirga sp.]
MGHVTTRRRLGTLRYVVPFWLIAMSSGVDADEFGPARDSAMFHCGTPPTSSAQVVAGPRLGLDATGRRVVRRNVTFPRYPCADAPERARSSIGGIEIVVDPRLLEAQPADARPGPGFRPGPRPPRRPR